MHIGLHTAFESNAMYLCIYAIQIHNLHYFQNKLLLRTVKDNDIERERLYPANNDICTSPADFSFQS